MGEIAHRVHLPRLRFGLVAVRGGTSDENMVGFVRLRQNPTHPTSLRVVLRASVSSWSLRSLGLQLSGLADEVNELGAVTLRVGAFAFDGEFRDGVERRRADGG